MIPVFCDPRQHATEPEMAALAAMREKAVLEHWKKSGRVVEVHSYEPASVEQLCKAHARDYVEDVLSGRRATGYGAPSTAAAEAERWAVGSMIAAVRLCARSRGAACATASGFHHAGWEGGEGLGLYCTFNGLVVAAAQVLQEGLVARVGILDCDTHHGNGTDDCLLRQPALAERVEHYSFCLEAKMGRPGAVRRWLEGLPLVVERMARVGCGVVLYQAGADPHVDDPRGGWLTTEEMWERDRLVFNTCRRLGLGVAWNLAGGYQSLPALLQLYGNTMQACVDSFKEIQ
jgi:acetoin utilization deacetylase AcuC-like enzyme